MRYEKYRMTFSELKTNTVNEKDYHTLYFLDGEANKESFKFTGSITDFENIKKNDFVDLYFKVYRDKERYYDNFGISIYKVEKSLVQE
ncbi:MAG: hypothetical protein J6C17_04430 [Clostridia bacterium]|nr:hypothetical protein [Clostridia bacterium]MBR3832318.1 hypothetical protein [Mycoplasmataceae bacterium]